MPKSTVGSCMSSGRWSRGLFKVHLFPSSYFFFQPCTHQTGLFTSFFFLFFFLIQFHSPISTYLSFPMFSGVYTLHTTLCIHAKSSRVFQQKSYLVLSYLVSKASRKQNRTFSSSLFPGSHVAIISFWLLHHCLSCHVASVTSLVSSPPCSFYFKIYIQIFCFHALSQ